MIAKDNHNTSHFRSISVTGQNYKKNKERLFVGPNLSKDASNKKLSVYDQQLSREGTKSMLSQQRESLVDLYIKGQNKKDKQRDDYSRPKEVKFKSNYQRTITQKSTALISETKERSISNDK